MVWQAGHDDAEGTPRPILEPSVAAQLYDLTAHRTLREGAVAKVAAAPIRYVTPAFLLALAGVDMIEPEPWTSTVPLRLAVVTG